MVRRGKFIVIEGIDGTGKATQLELLKKFLRKRKTKIKIDSYPHYETSVWGKMAGQLQMGQFGDPSKISPYLSVLPYMIDEYFGGQQIEKWLEKGYLVLADRYFTSGVHQVGKLEGGEQKRYRRWLWQTGWRELGICRPDLVIVLHLPLKISMELAKGKKQRQYTNGRGRDLVERDVDYQRKSAQEYLRMCRIQKDWVLIRCFSRQEKLMTKEEVHRQVVKILEKNRFV